MSEIPDPKSLAPAEWIRSERDFLHSMATPLMIAQGHLETSLENNPEDQRLQKAYKSVQRMADLTKERRSYLIEMTQSLQEGSSDE